MEPVSPSAAAAAPLLRRAPPRAASCATRGRLLAAVAALTLVSVAAISRRAGTGTRRAGDDLSGGYQQLCIHGGNWCPGQEEHQLVREKARFLEYVRNLDYPAAVRSAARISNLCQVLGRLARASDYDNWIKVMKEKYINWTGSAGTLQAWRSCDGEGCKELLERKGDQVLGPAPPPPGLDKIYIDTSKEFQEILGFGVALTEATAINYFKLPEAERRRLLEAHFAPPPRGNGYRLGRVHIGSCDFSPTNYTFADVPGDVNLTHFDDSVAHDADKIIPLIRAAMKVVAEGGGSLDLIGSPWSPPYWMKVPNSGGVQSQMSSAQPQGLLNEYRGTWANYISRWVSAYAAHGVPVWGVTAQNEPEFAAPWEACVYNSTHEADFIARFLGPTLRKDHPGLKLFAYDHNKDHVAQWAADLYGSPARDFIDGMAVHWYEGAHFGQMEGAHWIAPDKLLLGSEACCGLPSVEQDAFSCALSLVRDAVGDLNSWTAGWIDWNMLLDARGGPNHLGNFMAAGAMLSQEGSTFSLLPQYWVLGHLSRFVPPGSRRIQASAHLSQSQHAEGDAGISAAMIDVAAFRRPDGKHAMVAVNIGTDSLDFYVYASGSSSAGSVAAVVSLPPLSVHSFVW
eukprot:TRINITY_DN23839_c0_g1_i1.p1 TRINITY_DN23839_c0_g1~~TRINITY_DN23839_c0_g1_i1.p1  ORF type:complete len:625 (+),score=177.80 TRINITY_DN23839_c0_g1_i1:74-1948(+)